MLGNLCMWHIKALQVLLLFMILKSRHGCWRHIPFSHLAAINSAQHNSMFSHWYDFVRFISHVYHLWSWHHVQSSIRFIAPLYTPESPTALSSKPISWCHRCHVIHTCVWILVQLDMTSWFPPVVFSGALVHPFITHSIISQISKCIFDVHTCWRVLFHWAWSHVFSPFSFLVPLYTH